MSDAEEKKAMGKIKIMSDNAFGALLTQLRFLGVKGLLKYVLPHRVDSVLYSFHLGTYERQSVAKIDVSIEKSITPGITKYSALVDGNEVSHAYVVSKAPRLWQFGLEQKPMIVNGETIPEFRGLHIIPHVLSYMLYDLQTTTAIKEVYAYTTSHNQPAMRALERAGFKKVANLRGIQIGLFVFNRSVHWTDLDAAPL